jgi:hypothetical protein
MISVTAQSRLSLLEKSYIILPRISLKISFEVARPQHCVSNNTKTHANCLYHSFRCHLVIADGVKLARGRV